MFENIGDLLMGRGMTPLPPEQMPVPQGARPAAAATPTPVATPETVEQNKGLWRGFLANMNDPNFRTAMMMTGVNMLRSPQYGQNAGDLAANALTTGVNTLQGLRERDKLSKEKAQTRQDTLNQQGIQNRQTDTQIGVSQQNANTQATSVRQQGQAQTANQQLEREQQVETGRHNRATEANSRLSAQADMARAKAYSGAGTGRVPQDIQKINLLAEQYQREGMDEVSAKAKAVMIIESTGASRTPGEQARTLYQERLKAWGNDIANIGKTLTSTQAQELLDASIADIMALQTFNARATGAPPPATDRGGPIKRPGQPAAPQPAKTETSFADEAAAEAAIAAGQVKPGDIIVINGKRVRVK